MILLDKALFKGDMLYFIAKNPTGRPFYLYIYICNNYFSNNVKSDYYHNRGFIMKNRILAALIAAGLQISVFGSVVRADAQDAKAEIQGDEVVTAKCIKTVSVSKTGAGIINMLTTGDLAGHFLTAEIIEDCVSNDDKEYEESIIKLWNSLGDFVCTFEEPIKDESQFAVVDDKYFAISSMYDNGSIKVFEIASGKLLGTLSGHLEKVSCLIPLTQEKLGSGHFATGSDDGSIKIWDCSSCQCIRTLSGNSRINSLVELKIGSCAGLLASASGDGLLKLWDPLTGECLRTIKVRKNSHISIMELEDGSLATLEFYGNFKIFDPSNFELLFKLHRIDGKYEYRIVFGKRLMLQFCLKLNNSSEINWDTEKFFKHFNCKFGEPASDFTGDCAFRYSHLKNPSESIEIEDCTRKKKWNIYRYNKEDDFYPVEDPDTFVLRLKNGYEACLYKNDSTIKIFDSSTGHCVTILDGHTTQVISLIELPNGNLVSSAEDGTIKVWELSFKKVNDYSSITPSALISALEWHLKTGTQYVILQGKLADMFKELPQNVQDKYRMLLKITLKR